MSSLDILSSPPGRRSEIMPAIIGYSIYISFITCRRHTSLFTAKHFTSPFGDNPLSVSFGATSPKGQGFDLLGYAVSPLKGGLKTAVTPELPYHTADCRITHVKYHERISVIRIFYKNVCLKPPLLGKGGCHGVPHTNMTGGLFPTYADSDKLCEAKPLT